MTEQIHLDLARFRDLAAAYGGAVGRWPEPIRDTALRLARTPDGAAVLADADRLDRRLDAWRVAEPSGALAARIAATAPRGAPLAWSRARLWWSGAGLAAALAGAAAGTAAVAFVPPAAELADGGTSFGDVAGLENGPEIGS